METGLGYSEIEKVTFFGLALGEACIEAYAEPSPIQKAAAILGCADEFIDLLTLDREMLKAEWKDLSSAERDALIEACVQKFDLTDDVLENKIEVAFAATIKILEAVQGVADIWRKVV